MENSPKQVIVIGAGYAGLLAAVRLAGKTRKRNVAITLVNPTDLFVERPRMHQFATNQKLARLDLAHILQGTGVSFVKGLVSRIDTARHEIAVETNPGTRSLTYDKLIYALGSTIDRDSVPGVREHAYTLAPTGPLSADTLRQTLPPLNASGGRVLIIGGGATGVEAAAEFAESYPNLRVGLVTRGEFGAFLGKKIAAYMRRSLTRLGVTIQDNTTVTRVNADHAVTTAGVTIPFDLCLWAGGFIAPSLARDSGVRVNERGQVLIDPYMRSISHPDILAVGDAAHPVQDPGVPVRMSAVTAVILGAHGADSLTALLQDKTPQALSFAYIGQGIALGRHDAIGFNNYPDDKPRPPYLTGRLGYEGREFFVRLLADLPNLEKRLPGISYWPGKGRYAASQKRALARTMVKQT